MSGVTVFFNGKYSYILLVNSWILHHPLNITSKSVQTMLLTSIFCYTKGFREQCQKHLKLCRKTARRKSKIDRDLCLFANFTCIYKLEIFRPHADTTYCISWRKRIALPPLALIYLYLQLTPERGATLKVSGEGRPLSLPLGYIIYWLPVKRLFKI